MAAKPDDRIRLLKAEIVRLHAEVAVLDRQWSRKHWLAAFGLVAIPLMIARVPPIFIAITVIATPCLVATQAYLLYIRRRECKALIEQAKTDLDWVENGAPPMTRTSRA
jgi:hypothetical protein